MSDHGTNLYTAQRIAQHSLDEAARRASTPGPPASPPTPECSARPRLPAPPAGPCSRGRGRGRDDHRCLRHRHDVAKTPANPPVQGRIYPPTEVPRVRPGFMSADAAERRMAQNEEKLRRAGSNTTDSSACNWTVEQLPRTPDAVEGRYHDCRSHARVVGQFLSSTGPTIRRTSFCGRPGADVGERKHA